MKKLVLGCLGFVIFRFPALLGYSFLTIIAITGITAFAFHYTSAPISHILHYAWRVYLICTILTFVVMTTFTFQHCCVGINTFSGHIKHAGKHHFAVLFIAIFWPIGWDLVSESMAGWGISWIDIMLGFLEYWLITTWRGVRVEGFRVDKG